MPCIGDPGSRPAAGCAPEHLREPAFRQRIAGLHAKPVRRHRHVIDNAGSRRLFVTLPAGGDGRPPGGLDLLAVLDLDMARDRMHLEETVKLTMFAAGLCSDDSALAAGAGWVAERVVACQREFGLDAIQDAVSNRRLRAGPTRTIVSIATLTPDRLAAQAAHAIDWVDRFDGPDA